MIETLTAFLQARIAEREDAARNALAEVQVLLDAEAAGELRSLEWWLAIHTKHVSGGSGTSYVRSTVPDSPQEVLARCEADRRIVEDLWTELHEAEEHGDRHDAACALHYLRLLALPYVDHPDFREEWRP